MGRDQITQAARDLDAGTIDDGLYAAGWFRRGPRGTIPDNRAESLALADRIVADLEAAPAGDRIGSDVLPPDHEVVDWDGWKRLDAHELATAGAGRSRAKLASRDEMLKLRRQTRDAD